ncbi:MAG TPA: Gfo/Idh/MocA family oxidoreductase [Verrucomicrobiae bacterium]|jgi:predicted dehydrogenase|nr:Gfo/Idh/MocA family oxidoreductase [Verrucomicrobiae bacterium]
MKAHLNRRSFIKRTAVAAGAASAAGIFPVNLLAQGRHAAGDKLNCVQIGAGERGFQEHIQKQAIGRLSQNLYAVVDPDEKKHAAVRAWLQRSHLDPSKTQFFTDYREMFDKCGSNLDAAFVAAPNHHHATASAMALNHGISVYCEKPLCHDVAEARMLRRLAAKYPKLATQMGNQGHCEEGYRKLCEYVWAGAIGNITETHSWTDRSNGGVGPRPPVLPVPEGMRWDSWIGPAAYRDYHSDLHPHEWHGWYDFGNGSIGNMGCHVLDGVYWALKLEHPDSIELEQVRGGTDERYPTGSRVRWDFPARGEMPPVKVYWYEGLNPNTTANSNGIMRTAGGSARNLPPLYFELQKQYPDEEFGSNGTIYVGEKGYLYTGTYGEQMHLVPREKMVSTPSPAKTLARPKDSFTDFINAVREGRANTAIPFEYGAQLTEFVLLANLAMHAGLHNKVEWDGPGMKVKNIPALNDWVQRDHRKEWRV